MFSSKSKTIALTLVAGLALVVTDAMAQPGGRGGRGGRGGQARGGGGIQALLYREDVRRELEITDDQLEELRELGRDREGQRADRERLREELEGLSNEERRDKIRELREQRSEDMKAQLGEVLLPQQIRRLEQIAVQQTMQAGGQGLLRGQVADQLGITDEQRETIEKKAGELQKEFAKKMQKLRDEMQSELLKELTAEQRDKYREMIGESFQFEQNERGGRGRGAERGQRGRRGERGERGRNGDEDF